MKKLFFIALFAIGLTTTMEAQNGWWGENGSTAQHNYNQSIYNSNNIIINANTTNPYVSVNGNIVELDYIFGYTGGTIFYYQEVDGYEFSVLINPSTNLITSFEIYY